MDAQSELRGPHIDDVPRRDGLGDCRVIGGAMVLTDKQAEWLHKYLSERELDELGQEVLAKLDRLHV